MWNPICILILCQLVRSQVFGIDFINVTHVRLPLTISHINADLNGNFIVCFGDGTVGRYLDDFSASAGADIDTDPTNTGFIAGYVESFRVAMYVSTPNGTLSLAISVNIFHSVDSQTLRSFDYDTDVLL